MCFLILLRDLWIQKRSLSGWAAGVEPSSWAMHQRLLLPAKSHGNLSCPHLRGARHTLSAPPGVVPGKDKGLHSEANLPRSQKLSGSPEAKPASTLEPSASCRIPSGFSEINPVKVKWPKWKAKLREVDLENWRDTLTASSKVWLSGNSETKSLN